MGRKLRSVLSILLTLCMVVSMVNLTAFAGTIHCENGNHVGGDTYIGENKNGKALYVCAGCGEPVWSDGNNWHGAKKDDLKTDTCAHPGQRNEEVITEPTCTKPGEKKTTCFWCGGDEKTETIDPLGHTFDEALWTDNCTSQMDEDCTGHSAVCTRCHGGETDGEGTKSEPHNYGEWKTVTDGVPGEQKHTCTVCGHFETKVMSTPIGDSQVRYIVQWLDENGEQLKAQDIRQGAVGEEVKIDSDADKADIILEDGTVYTWDSENQGNVMGDRLKAIESDADIVILKLYFKATVPVTPPESEMMIVQWVRGYGSATSATIKHIIIAVDADYADEYPVDPIREDHVFLGWSDPVESTAGDGQKVLTITAQWGVPAIPPDPATALYYVVIHYVDSESWDAVSETWTKSLAYDYTSAPLHMGDHYEVTSPEIKGYTLYTPEYDTVISGTITAGNIGGSVLGKNVQEFWVTYKKNAEQINVRWMDGYSDTATGGQIKFVTIEDGADYSSEYPADPTREGYTFAGWSDPVESTAGDGQKVITITAQWVVPATPLQPAIPTVKYINVVYWGVDGGMETKLGGTQVTLRAGETFVADPQGFRGWAYDHTDVESVSFEECDGFDTVNVYYVKAYALTVTYEYYLNGVRQDILTQTATDVRPVGTTIFVNVIPEFTSGPEAGYSTTEESRSITLTEDMTITIRYIKDSRVPGDAPVVEDPEITTVLVQWLRGYSTTAADATIKSIVIVEGTDYKDQYPAAPTMDGWVFYGWSEPIESTAADGQKVITIVAQWDAAPAPTPNDPTPSVTYYTLTINYVDQDGNTVADSVTRTLAAGSAYSVASPEFEYMVADLEVAAGTLTQNTTVTVTYYFLDEVIYEDTPPLSETPEDPEPSEQPEEPGEEIEDPDTPLAELPEQPEEPDEDIDDGETPLANVPQTGDKMTVWLVMAVGSGMGLIALNVTRLKGKREED